MRLLAPMGAAILVGTVLCAVPGVASTAAAQSNTLDLGGKLYGNASGCTVVEGGNYSSDDKLILRPEAIEFHETWCEFVQVFPTREGAHLALTACQSEGQYEIRSFMISPPDPENPSLVLFRENGEPVGEVLPCG
jgi:hypothetical protein